MIPPGRCPLCAAQTVRVRAEDGGAIEDDTWFGRRVRPASFYACQACEWCSEGAPLAWRSPPQPETERP